MPKSKKELLAIVFACERFDQYVYGREKVSVQSDHKPLEAIFKKPLVTAPKRLQRMMLRLQRYSLDVNYTRGSEMHIADTLSRAYIPGKPSVHAINIAKTDMTTGLSVSPKRLKELQAATADDLETYSETYSAETYSGDGEWLAFTKIEH